MQIYSFFVLGLFFVVCKTHIIFDVDLKTNPTPKPECKDMDGKEQQCKDMIRYHFTCKSSMDRLMCPKTCKVCFKPCEDKRTCGKTPKFFCDKLSSMKSTCPVKCGICKEGEELPLDLQ